MTVTVGDAKRPATLVNKKTRELEISYSRILQYLQVKFIIIHIVHLLTRDRVAQLVEYLRAILRS